MNQVCVKAKKNGCIINAMLVMSQSNEPPVGKMVPGKMSLREENCAW